jgi:DHA1 family tetracycline resistance protein-like MFS transporter
MVMEQVNVRRGLVPVLVAVLVLFSAQQLLTPVLAPLSRRLDMTETQLGIVITVAAAALTIASPLWGRAVDHWGYRRVLVSGLVLSCLGLAGFAGAAVLGWEGETSGGTTFTFFLVTRSLIFGAGVAAIPVCAFALAATNSAEAERTKAIGMVGAAQGVSMMLGPAIGGGLSFISLLAPLIVAPILVLLIIGWVLLTIKAAPAKVSSAVKPARVKLSPFDNRIFPYLMIGFLLFLALSMMQINIGFLVADTLGLSDVDTATTVGGMLFATGLILVGVQGALVPKLKWPALRLLRTGAPIAGAGFAVLVFATSLPLLLLSMVLIALGLGLAMPGYATAPTLAVPQSKQGAVSGLVHATNGLTFVIGPVAGTALYERSPSIPIAISVVMCLLACVALWVHPKLRHAAIAAQRATVEPPALTPETVAVND